MSYNPLHLRCHSCGISGSSSALNGKCSYILADGTEINLERSLGFCDDCAAFTAIENLDIDQSQSRLSDAVCKRDQKELLLKQLSSGWLAKLGFRNNDIRQLNRALEFIKAQIVRLQLHVTLCMQRAGCPRCIDCGSTAVRTLIMPRGADLSATGKISVPMPHLNCNDLVEITQSQLRMSFPQKEPRYFDMFCNPI